MTPGRRVHHQAVVFKTAFGGKSEEGAGVFVEAADGAAEVFIGGNIFLGPIQNTFGAIDVKNFSASGGHGQATTAGVGEEIRYAHSLALVQGFTAMVISSCSQAQTGACSGNMPQWPKPVKRRRNWQLAPGPCQFAKGSRVAFGMLPRTTAIACALTNTFCLSPGLCPPFVAAKWQPELVAEPGVPQCVQAWLAAGIDEFIALEGLANEIMVLNQAILAWWPDAEATAYCL